MAACTSICSKRFHVSTERDLIVTGLRIDDDSDLVATGHASPRLSWTLLSRVGDIRQDGFEIEIATDPDFESVVARSGMVRDPRPYLATWPAPPLKSREVRFLRVRVL